MSDFIYEEIAPTVLLYKNVINNCDEIIDIAKDESFLWDDAHINAGSDEEGNNLSLVNKNIRNTKAYGIQPTLNNDIMWFDISQRIWKTADHYAKKFDIAFSNMEPPQLLYYPAGEGFYKPHSDHGPSNPRLFSSVLYLNDIEEGGETYFTHFDIAVKPRAGDMVVFPSNYTFLHEAKSPISDDKYVVVTWYTPYLS